MSAKYRKSLRFDQLIIVLALLISGLLYAQFRSEDTSISVPELPDVPGGYVADTEGDTPDAAPPARANAAVRFLMYNVHDYFVDKDPPRSQHSRHIKPKDQREAVASVIASAKPEIVGLVEIGGPAALDDLAERLAGRGLSYPHRKVLTRWREDRALGVLSMHPIVEDHSVADCKLVGRTNKPMLRGILDVTVQHKRDNRRFRIMGVHLKSQVSDDPTASDALRAREALTLMEHIENAMKSDPQAPILVYGDWNDVPKSPALAVMTRRNEGQDALQRLSPKDDNGESWTIYYKENNVYNTFDQIYINSVLAKRLTGRKGKKGIIAQPAKGARPSDHRAVWCDLF